MFLSCVLVVQLAHSNFKDIDRAKDSNIGSVTTLKKLPNNTIEATLDGSTLNLSANR